MGKINIIFNFLNKTPNNYFIEKNFTYFFIKLVIDFLDYFILSYIDVRLSYSLLTLCLYNCIYVLYCAVFNKLKF